MSALITRASISSVTPGRVATRVPLSEAARRAAVCESDCTVGASTASAAAIAPATASRRLGGVRAAFGHKGQDGIRPGSARFAAKPLAEPKRRRVADHEDLLALRDPEALVHDGVNRFVEIAHGVRP